MGDSKTCRLLAVITEGGNLPFMTCLPKKRGITQVGEDKSLILRSLWITFTPNLKNLHSCWMKHPSKKKAAISLTFFLIANLYSDAAIATQTPETEPRTKCFIEVGDPHLSTYLNERRGLKAVKADAESRCNFFQKNVILTVTIFKVGRFSNHFVKEFRTDPANPKSSGFTVKNWQTYELCKMKRKPLTMELLFLKLKSMANYSERSRHVQIIQSP